MNPLRKVSFTDLVSIYYLQATDPSQSHFITNDEYDRIKKAIKDELRARVEEFLDFLDNPTPP